MIMHKTVMAPVNLDNSSIPTASDFGSAILGLFKDMVPVTGSCFYRVNEQTEVFQHSLLNLEAEWLTAYQDYFGEADPLHPSRYADNNARVAILDETTAVTRQARDYVASFLMPQNTPYQLEVYLRDQHRIIGGLSLLRSSVIGPFSKDECRLIERVVPFAEFCLDQILDNAKLEPAEKFSFTDREHEIVGLVCSGLSNKDICRRLAISLPTVKTHLSRIFTKAEVQTRTALIHKMYDRH